jgi:hypothetical protein
LIPVARVNSQPEVALGGSDLNISNKKITAMNRFLLVAEKIPSPSKNAQAKLIVIVLKKYPF